ncbi:MAG: hypothetical protein WCP98_13775 [Actinomycetes bacterium]
MQGSGTIANLIGVAFSDATHGWTVGYGGAILASTTTGVVGPPMALYRKLTPPAVPSRVRAGARVESWGTVKPALKSGDRIVVFWEHYIGGRWQMVLAAQPAYSYGLWNSSWRYGVRMKFKPGKWRVRALAGDVSSAYRIFTAD